MKITEKIKASLGKYEFVCSSCGQIHDRSMWSVAHMNEDQVFSCDCGAKVVLKGVSRAAIAG